MIPKSSFTKLFIALLCITFFNIEEFSAQQQCPEWTIGEWGECSNFCGDGIRTRSVACYCNGVLVADANCNSPKPPTAEACNTVTYSWVTGNFGECNVVCGEGTQIRSVTCQDCTGATASDANCTGSKPANTQSCEPEFTYAWETGAFGECTGECGSSIRTRVVVCKTSVGETVDDCNCMEQKPQTSESCFVPGCGIGIGVSDPEADLHLRGTLKIENGSEGNGKILMSDDDGNASWQDLPATSMIEVTDQDALLKALPQTAILEVIDEKGQVRKFANPSILVIYLIDKIHQQEAELDKQKIEILKLKSRKN